MKQSKNLVIDKSSKAKFIFLHQLFILPQKLMRLQYLKKWFPSYCYHLLYICIGRYWHFVHEQFHLHINFSQEQMKLKTLPEVHTSKQLHFIVIYQSRQMGKFECRICVKRVWSKINSNKSEDKQCWAKVQFSRNRICWLPPNTHK